MTRIKWIAHACFQIITDNNKIIYTDPYQITSGEPADILLISHDHYDHADEKSIKTVFTENTKLICPKSCEAGLKKFNATGLDPNESMEIEGIKINAVPAYNPDKSFHPKGNKWLGFVFEAAGKRIYHAGDTGPIPEMKNLPAEIDVALVPVGGKYTMGFSDAIEVCKMINPKIFIPMHHWGANLNELKNMINKANPTIRVEILKGKDLEF